MDYRDIGRQIRKKRIARSWRQEDLAERADLSVTYIGMIERGEKIPKLETFVTIANVLETSADELLTGVLNNGFAVRMTQYTERIEELNKRDQYMIYDIIDSVLKYHSGKGP